MNDMSLTTLAKSDQLNADDLLGDRTMTIVVTRVDLNLSSEQPCSIYFEGDSGKPYKPGKSMRRVLVYAWGPDASQYKGRAMTLYRDGAVKFGGLDVGGIRISHMSHIDGPINMALTATKGKKSGFRVLPLQQAASKGAPQQAQQPRRTLAVVLAEKIATCRSRADVAALREDVALKPYLGRESVEKALNEAHAKFSEPEADLDADLAEEFPGDAIAREEREVAA